MSAEISGDVLLDADEEFLTELGVDTALDRVRIMTLFPRTLEEVEPKYPVSEVVKYLQENKMEKYIKLFEENEIDGDMLLDTDPTLMKAVLKEIGVGVVDRVKILSKFKTFTSIEAQLRLIEYLTGYSELTLVNVSALKVIQLYSMVVIAVEN